MTFSIILLLLATAAPAVTLDLSLASGTVQKETATAGQPFVFEIINMVPKLAYNVSFEVEPVVPPELILPEGFSASARTMRNATTCGSILTQFSSDVNAAVDEKKVAELVQKARLDMDGCTPSDKLRLNALIANTTATRSFTLREGTELTVTVSRKQENETKTWTLIVSTGSPGSFFAMYGFNFMQANDDRFFLKPKEIVTTPANPATNTAEQKSTVYTITKQQNRLRQVFSPSVMFTWSSRERLLGEVSPWIPVPIAGLGFDGSDPNVFGGLAWIYHTNLSLNVGVGMTKVKKLVGSLTPNTDIKDQLTDAQLYESTYKPRLFFGASFRFGENPLKPKETPK
jgi:hypothetical protein